MGGSSDFDISGDEDIQAVLPKRSIAPRFAAARDFVRNHEVLTFFLLAYTITWGAFALVPLVTTGDQIDVVALPLIMVAPFAPALSGIVVTRIVDDGPRDDSIRGQAVAFVVALVATTLVFLLNPNLWEAYDFSWTLVAVSVVVAITPSYVISSAFSGSRGVRDYLASLVKPRAGMRWYLVAVLFFPAVALPGVSVTDAFGPGDAGFSMGGLLGLGAPVAVTFLYQLVYGNCVGEEPGWRGFALRKLQGRHSPLVASLAVNFFWVLWHLPYWFFQGGGLTGEYVVRQFVVGGALGVVFSWLYNRSGGSILAVGMMHASGNTAAIFVPETPAVDAILLVVTFLVVALDRMWVNPSSDGIPGRVR